MNLYGLLKGILEQEIWYGFIEIMKKILKKIIIYTAIAFLLIVISGDSLVIKMNGLTTMYIIRMLIWAGLIVILLYLDGGWFAKKNGDEVKYSKTKSNII